MIAAELKSNLGPLLDLKSRGVRLAVRVGVSRAAKPVREAFIAEAQAIARYGFLAKAVASRQQLYQGGLVCVVVIGPKRSYQRTKGSYTRGKRKGEKRRIVPAKYALLVQKGTAHSRPRPFVSNAMERAGDQYKENVAKEIAAEIQKVLPKG